MSEEEPVPPAQETEFDPSLLGDRWPWVALPVAAYLLSPLAIGAGAVFVPAVIAKAPMGLIGWFVKDFVAAKDDAYQTSANVIHVVFWLTLISCICLRKRTPAVLRTIVYLVLLLILLFDLVGCGKFYAGSRDPGNWH